MPHNTVCGGLARVKSYAITQRNYAVTPRRGAVRAPGSLFIPMRWKWAKRDVANTSTSSCCLTTGVLSQRAMCCSHAPDVCAPASRQNGTSSVRHSWQGSPGQNVASFTQSRVIGLAWPRAHLDQPNHRSRPRPIHGVLDESLSGRWAHCPWIYTFVVNGGPVGILNGAAQSQMPTADDGGSLLRVDLNNATGVERVRIRLSRTIASPSDGEALSLDVELLSFDVDIN